MINPSPWRAYTNWVYPLQGAVLLDAAMQPRTVWEFEAVMVLLSGHWPPRGLLSGAHASCHPDITLSFPDCLFIFCPNSF